MFGIAETARLETASETLAEFIGYLNSLIEDEQMRPAPDEAKIRALESQMDILVRERKELTPDNSILIDKAIYVYAPLLKPMHA